MAWAAVQENDSGQVNGASDTSLTVAWPGTPTEGNLLIAVFATSEAGAGSPAGITGPTDYTLVEQVIIQQGSLSIWYKISEGDEGSETASFTGITNDRVCMWIGEYSGVDSDNPIDVFQGAGSTTTESGTGHTDRPGFKGGLYLTAHSSQNSGAGTTFTAPAADHDPENRWTATGSAPISHRNGSGDGVRLQLRIFEYLSDATYEEPGDYSFSYDTSAQRENCGIVVVFRADGAAASSDDSDVTGAPGAWVQDGSASSTVAGTTLSVTLGVNPTVGNLLVAMACDPEVLGDISPPDGTWTEITSWDNLDHNTTRQHIVWAKFVTDTSEDGAITFTWASSTTVRGLIVTEMSGVAANGIADASFTDMWGSYSLTQGALLAEDPRFCRTEVMDAFDDAVGIGFVFTQSSNNFSANVDFENGWTARESITPSTLSGTSITKEIGTGGKEWAWWDVSSGDTTVSRAYAVIILFHAAPAAAGAAGWAWHGAQPYWQVID